MRRRSTILSLPSLLIFSILATGLGWTIWRQGGLAFSPGDLSGKNDADIFLEGYSSHAEFEGQCSLCHQPLTKLQAELCTDCHGNITEQIDMKMSVHGNIENVVHCAECHSDHRGRQYDLRLENLGDFNHSSLGFSLIWHQIDYSMQLIECLGCHAADESFSMQTSSCTSCHAEHEQDFMLTHTNDFGGSCTSCHDGLDSMARFDHTISDFPLVGTHEQLSCVECHIDGQFEDLQSDCIACHEEPTGHQGLFGLDCETCHDSISWKPAYLNGQAFEHDTGTRFNLDLHSQDYAGEAITCQSCHQESLDKFSMETCIDCHVTGDEIFITQHQAELGGKCLECHDGVDRMRNFVHQELFPLEGSHSVIECQACHVDQVYQGTPNECKDCHPEPEIHAGFFGLKCEYCHETLHWVPAQLHSHEFPIAHGDQPGENCQLCHISTYEQYTCYACHEHDESDIREKHARLDLLDGELARCIDCHADGLVHEKNENGN